MRLALVGKYPPIQGGVSRSMFWMAHALAENGIDVHVVTNAQEVEPEFRAFDLGAWEPALKLAGEPQARSGIVVVHTTTSDGSRPYLPWANPFVTKLAALVAAVVEEQSCSLMHGSYWEPYGMAAHLASTWTGVPFGLQHAGSDVGRLYLDEQMGGAYRRMLAAADFQILSAQTCELSQKLALDPLRLYPLAAALPPMEFFSPETAALDIPLALRCVRDYFSKQSPLGPDYAQFAEHDFDADRPTIGIFGKISKGKSLVELIAALGELIKRGIRFNFVVMGQARRTQYLDFMSWLDAFGVRDRTFLLPFLPHWQVPHFIRACDVVCTLEKHFPIAFHTPVAAMEVVSCGTCLLMSDEIASKQIFGSNVRNGHNAFIVDPTDEIALKDILTAIVRNRKRTAEVGCHGEQELALRDRSGAYGTKVTSSFLKIAREVSERRAIGRLWSDIAAFARAAKSAGLDTDIAADTAYRLDGTYRAARLPSLFDFVRLEMKMTHRILGHSLRDLFDAFYLSATIPSDSDASRVVLAFCENLLRKLQAAGDIPAYAGEVLRFEMRRVAMKAQVRAPTRAAWRSVIPDDCRPIAARGLEILESGFDFPRLINRLSDANDDAPLPRPEEFRTGSCCLALKRVHRHEIEPELLRISSGSRAILVACNGRRTIEDVIAAVLDDYPAETRSSVRQGLEKLWQAACIEDQAARQRLSDLRIASPPAATPESRYEFPRPWHTLGLCGNAYPKRVIQLLIGRNVDRAHFNLQEHAGSFVLRYRPLQEGYGEGEILDELNYLAFAEKQREIAEPIRKEIVSGLVRKFGGEAQSGEKSSRQEAASATKSTNPDGIA